MCTLKRPDGKRIWRLYLIDLLVMTIIFLILYHSFLFDGQMYAYSDVGADTIDQYLPNMCYDTEKIRSGVYGEYDLSYGLGSYTGGYLLKYLNPVNLPILLLGQEQLPTALMISLYLKYALICLFALLYFDKLLGNDKVAAVCALLWTFSGYSVLWGQHYNFMTSILSFTVAMYGFQLYLDDDKLWYLVIPAIALLAVTSYYFLYISCYFFLIYGVLYLAFRKSAILRIIKKAGGFVLVMLLAACMAGESLWPRIAVFFSSSRVDQVANATPSELLYGTNYLYGYLARFLSNDLIGTGDLFYGPVNYYEFAILSVSVLSVFSFAYLIQGKYWKRTVALYSIGILSLCFPTVNRLLTFSEVTQRWTYLLCFAQVIGIGFALADGCGKCNKNNGRKRIVRTVLIADAIMLLVCTLLYHYHVQTGGWILNKNACCKIVLILVAYHLAAFGVLVTKKHEFVIIMTIVAMELTVANYGCVNQRSTISVDQWRTSMYNDGTQEIVQWIHEQDQSLYRINKTYTSVSNCDALMQGYYGMATYSSTNPAELVSLAKSYGYASAGNRIRFAANDLLANTMLGVKYVITGKDEVLDPEYYEKIYSDENYCVYENKYWIGFGYIYQQEAEQKDVLADTSLDILVTMSDKYYFTEQVNPDRVDRTVGVDLLPYLSGNENCEILAAETISMTGTGYDMSLSFVAPEIPENYMAAGIRVKITAEKPSSLTVVTEAVSEAGAESRRDVIYYDAGTGTYELNTVTGAEIGNIQLYLSWEPQSINIEAVELMLLPGQTQLQQNLLALQKNGNVNAEYTQEGFSISLQTPMDETVMLCVPLIYSQYWHATVNGKEATVHNINGGLIGIELQPGETDIGIEYANHLFKVGNCISIAGLVVFLAVVCWNHRCKTAKKHKIDL